MSVLDLDDYRRLVDLDEPFRAGDAAPPEQRDGLVTALADALAAEDPLAGLAASGEPPRRRLRTLLTIRRPRHLARAVERDLDRLLQHEARARPRVDPTALPRLAGIAPAYPAAARTALWQGDLTTLAADAIVNAANDRLLGCFVPTHPCIDNAVHAAAGPRLRADCHRIMEAQGGREPVGAAKATRGYHLPARFVLHTVGPIVKGRLRAEHAEALAGCYRSCLDLAARLPGVRTVAFCAISTGAFGFPREPAARVALGAVAGWLAARPDALDLVVFDVFGDADREAYLAALR